MEKLGKKQHVFERELAILNKSKEFKTIKVADSNLLFEEYAKLSQNFEQLLSDSMLLTSVSDRLQNKLNKANETLEAQAEKIKQINADLEKKNKDLVDTIDKLKKAKAGRKATTLVLLFAVFLFILSEGIIEPFVERELQNEHIGFFIKGCIALSLKPLESYLEKYLVKKSLKI